MNDQQQLPLGTTEQLVLNIAETGTTKEQLISELDNITNKHNATLVKVVIPSDEYKNKKIKKICISVRKRHCCNYAVVLSK